MSLICFNGVFLPAAHPVLTAQNRSFKWGDGLFETIKVLGKRILLETHHYERLFKGLKLLQMQPSQILSPELLTKNILELCRRNECLSGARVRLAVYRTGENGTEYIIEALPLPAESQKWNEEGFVAGIYPYARKAIDAFSNLKTANFLPYVMASLYANENQLDDALVLNADNRIADSSRANIFLVHGNDISTPSLDQACINGVMRRFLIDGLKATGRMVYQKPLSEKDLLNADEIFLTNSIQGIRWVKRFKEKEYGSAQASSFYKEFILPDC
jgi:branched-chain amino acid aminotransferase